MTNRPLQPLFISRRFINVPIQHEEISIFSSYSICSLALEMIFFVPKKYEQDFKKAPKAKGEEQ